MWVFASVSIAPIVCICNTRFMVKLATFFRHNKHLFTIPGLEAEAWQVIIDTLCRKKSGGRAAVANGSVGRGKEGLCQRSDSLGAQHCQSQRWLALFCVPDCICAPCHLGVTCQNMRSAPFLMLMPCNDSFVIPRAVLALNKSRCDSQ